MAQNTLLVKLIVAQLFKKYSVFYDTLRFITIFTKLRKTLINEFDVVIFDG